LRELALHVLDLVENSVRAGAGVIAVTVEEQPAQDLLAIEVEDDGPGLPVETAVATDPFFTTKEGKRTGLGLSLFRARAEQAGGAMQLDRSPLGGLRVRVTMRLGHVDRTPIGDLAATVSGAIAANPGVELRVRLRVGDREVSASSAGPARSRLAAARGVREAIREGMAALHMTE
jgi:hypothetical protein